MSNIDEQIKTFEMIKKDIEEMECVSENEDIIISKTFVSSVIQIAIKSYNHIKSLEKQIETKNKIEPVIRKPWLHKYERTEDSEPNCLSGG